MKLALPLTATNEFSVHYGAAAKFEVFEVDPAQHLVHRRLIVVPQASEPCAWPTLLRAAGVDLILAGGMGAGARAHMDEYGLAVLIGVPAAPPEEIVDDWMSGNLRGGSNSCNVEGRGGYLHPEAHDPALHCRCAPKD